MNEQEFAELSAGHALNALSPQDSAAYEHALATHPEWAHIADADAAAVAVLAEGAPAAAPPLAMRGILLSKIMSLPQDAREADAAPAALPPVPPLPAFALESTPIADAISERRTTPEPETISAPDDETSGEPETESVADLGTVEDTDSGFVDVPAPTTTSIQAVSRRNWTRGLFTLAASLVLLVVLGYGAANLNGWINRPAEVVALQEIEGAPDAQSATVEIADGGVATAHWSGSLGKAVLVTDGLPTIASGETFELWFVRDDGTPVSAGTFAAAGEETTAVLAGAMEVGDTIAVTVEEAGGSPTGVPTTDPIVAIPTA